MGAEEERTEAPGATTRSGPLGPAVLVFAVVLILTGVLAGISEAVYTHNENRLLKLRAREAGSILGATLPGIQTTLASADELAGVTNGDRAKFRHFIAPYVGLGQGTSFVSASLWRLPATGQGPLAVVGVAPKLSPAHAQAVFEHAARSSTLSVTGLLSAPSRRLGYAFVAPGSDRRYVVYAERTVPPNRLSRIHNNPAVSGLDYALYLGHSPRPANLLVASVARVPLKGRSASDTVPFGDMVITLVVSPRGVLSGSLPQALPWIIAIGGALLALVAGLVTYRLIDRRHRAEELAERLEQTAGENRRLYAEQRDIAQTLQHALLPSALPRVSGIESSALYKAGEQGVEIGGDWYDLIAVGDGKLLLVVGDVSGRGLPAAITMAALRYAIEAYAAQNDSPPVILTKLSRLVSVAETGQLATVLCALIDVEGRRLTFSNAGHLPPLLLSNGRGDYLEGHTGLPIGVEADALYSSTTVTVPPEATVLAFTDGLVERRGESLDASLERLREMANAHGTPLPELLDDLVADLHDEPSEDDSAILGLRWTS